jgi:hypothetical protein
VKQKLGNYLRNLGGDEMASELIRTWAAENARCGDISEYYADDIAAAVGYYGDKSSDLMSALLKSGVISHGDGWTGAFIRGWETIASA